MLLVATLLSLHLMAIPQEPDGAADPARDPWMIEVSERIQIAELEFIPEAEEYVLHLGVRCFGGGEHVRDEYSLFVDTAQREIHVGGEIVFLAGRIGNTYCQPGARLKTIPMGDFGGELAESYTVTVHPRRFSLHD